MDFPKYDEEPNHPAHPIGHPNLGQRSVQRTEDILHIQLSDNVKARHIDPASSNDYVKGGMGDKKVRSQYEIYDYLKSRSVL